MEKNEGRNIQRAIVLSDLHFGEEGDTLSDHKMVDSVISELEVLGTIDEIILAGDIFDLWVSSLRKAIQNSEYFFRRLSEIKNLDGNSKIIYLPGNHDYHVLIQHKELHDHIEEILRGKVPNFTYQPKITYEDSFLKGLFGKKDDINFILEYPDHIFSVDKKNFLVHHGHYLELLKPGIFGIICVILQLLMGIPKLRTRKDIEKVNTIYFEQLYNFSLNEVIRGKIRGFWDWVQKKIKERERKRSKKRGSEVSVFRSYIKEYFNLEDSPSKSCHCYIFGHTHVPGIDSESSVILANTGSFFRDPESGIIDFNTYIVVEEDSLYLRKVGTDKEISSVRFA